MKPRKRDRHLPACVYLRHGAYYYVQKGKWRRLGTDLQTALAEYARIISLPEEAMPKLIDRALPSIIEGKAKSTQQQYLYAARLLSEGFAEFAPHDVRTSDVIKMLDAYKQTPATAQRLLVVLNAVFSWACARDIVPTNPCREAKRPPPLKRDRLITAGEYEAIRAQAPKVLQSIMDVCRLTGQRIGDVLSMKRSQIEDDGIRFVQQKTGTELLVAWSPELRAAIEQAKTLSGPVIGLTLFSSRGGKQLNHANVWRAFKLAAERAGVPDVRPHDLRALAATEAHAQGLDATALLGHKSARTTEVYLRDKTPKVAKPPSYSASKKPRKAG